MMVDAKGMWGSRRKKKEKKEHEKETKSESTEDMEALYEELMSSTSHLILSFSIC
jgi:hypothetical protein